MYIKTKKKWQFALEIAMIVLGTMLMGFAFSVFLEPNNISTGGFSALAMIINVLFVKIGLPDIPTSIIYLVLNIGLYFLAIKSLGKRFAIKSLVGILSFSLGMQLFSMIGFNITYELLISAVYGGAIMGVGVGLVVRFGGSTGGTDMVASMVKKHKPNATFGTLIVSVDMVIIFLSLFVFTNGLELLPYTILALLLSMFVTDFVTEGYKQVRAYNIITTKPEMLGDAIMQQLSRGCTCTQVVGMHSKSDKYILTCLISRFQAGQLQNIIKEIDPSAFVYMTKVTDVIGSWSSVKEIQKEAELKQAETASGKMLKKQTKTNVKNDTKDQSQDKNL